MDFTVLLCPAAITWTPFWPWPTIGRPRNTLRNDLMRSIFGLTLHPITLGFYYNRERARFKASTHLIPSNRVSVAFPQLWIAPLREAGPEVWPKQKLKAFDWPHPTWISYSKPRPFFSRQPIKGLDIIIKIVSDLFLRLNEFKGYTFCLDNVE